MRLFAGAELDRPPRCEQCGELDEDCQCPPEPEPRLAPGKQTARLSKEKRKKGKLVTVIRGLSAEGNDLPSLLKQLKSACGAGGTLQEDSIEIQGDQIDRIRDALKEIGFKVKG
jgi:translation initiation factor 1